VRNVRKPTHKRISKYLQRMAAALYHISRSLRSTATAGNAPIAAVRLRKQDWGARLNPKKTEVDLLRSAAWV
jgi:hypothetical protein